MKNLNLFVFIIVIISSLLASCQKDQLEDISPNTNKSTEQSISDTNGATSAKSPIDVNLLKENMSQTIEVTSKRISATSRSNGDQLIYDYEGYISENDAFPFTQSKVWIGSGKYRVVLKSLTGDADLTLVGEDDYYGDWREIRSSSKYGSDDDVLEYTASDLNSNESDMIIVVKGYRSSKFRLEIYRVNVSECNNQSAIEKIKETLCFCEVNTLYHAEYFGEPVLFVEQQCTELLDAGGYSVYDCEGNQIAYTGYYTINPVQEEHLTIKGKIYECSNGNDCLWGDDFERLPVGTNVAQETELWSAWTSESPSGIVTANKTLEFNRNQYGKQDIVFNLGKKSSKIYKVSWEMYIETNSTAYFNIQASNYTNEFVSGGEYGISFGTNLAQYQNKWFDVEVYFDLDRNKLKVSIDNGRFEEEINYTADMGGINFYSMQDAHFYLDNVCVKEVNQIPLTSQTEATSRSRSTDTRISTTALKN